MTPEQHEQLARWFEEASELDGPELSAFLERARGEDAELAAELTRLRALDTDDGTLARPAVVALEGAARQALDGAREERQIEATLPDQVGPYRVLREIGRGGMGVVYEAEQESPLRHVAVKVMRADVVTDAMLRRFEQESQVLARLNHPGIAQIFESGTDRSQGSPVPFLAMELVEGVTVTQYCETERPSVERRLEIIAEIADAVDHAHRRGVVHRDLKPANVLVDGGGRTKVLDFGVAMNLEVENHVSTMHTKVGEVIGTLSYMSPEQVGGRSAEVDARSDVYALGVLAHEILAGAPPFDLRGKLIHEAARIVAEDDPSTLGAIDTALRGDIERIVGKALEKEPERRYTSAEALATDLRRHLAHEPISATAPSFAYQARKFARRHRGFVIGLATTLVALLVGLVVSTVLYLDSKKRGEELIVALENQRVALENQRVALAEANSVTDFVSSILAAASPNENDAELTVRELLNRTSPDIEESFSDEPRVAARLHLTIAQAYRELGADDKALKHARDAAALRDSDPDSTPEERAAPSLLVARVLTDLGQLDESDAVLEKGLAGARTSLLRARHLLLLGRNARNRSLMDEARARFDEVIALVDAGVDDPETRFSALNQLAMLDARTGDIEGALPMFEEVLEYRIAAKGRDHPWVLEARHNIGTALSMLGRYDEVLEVDREILRSRRHVLGDLHPSTLVTVHSIGEGLSMLGRFEEAEPYLREAVDGHTKNGTNTTIDGLNSRGALTRCLDGLGRLEEALDLYEDATKDALETFGEEHWLSVMLIDNCGETLRKLERYDEAIEHHRRAERLASKTLGPKSPMAIRTLDQLAKALDWAYRHEEAIEVAQETLERAEGVQGISVTGVRERLLQLYLKAVPDALQDVDRALEIGATLGADPNTTAAGWGLYAEALAKKRRFKEASEILERAFEMCPADDPNRALFLELKAEIEAEREGRPGGER